MHHAGQHKFMASASCSLHQLVSACREGDGHVWSDAEWSELLSAARAHAVAPDGSSLLHIAADAGASVVIARLLLESDVSLLALDRSGKTPAMLAASRGHVGVLRALTASSAPTVLTSAKKNGWTPLHLAVSHKQVEAAAFLCAAVPQDALHACTNEGATPLYIAAREGGDASVQLCELLLQHGAAVDARTRNRRTPLHAACACGAPELVSMLLAQGADVCAVDSSGMTPLLEAAGRGDVMILNATWNASHPAMHPRMSAQVDITGKGALHHAVMRRCSTAVTDSTSAEACTWLLERGCNVHARDERGATPLYYAATVGDVAAVAVLLSRGARLDVPMTVRTPLHAAAMRAHLPVVELLIAHASVHSSVADMLLVEDADGMTALQVAAALAAEPRASSELQKRAQAVCAILQAAAGDSSLLQAASKAVVKS